MVLDHLDSHKAPPGKILILGKEGSEGEWLIDTVNPEDFDEKFEAAKSQNRGPGEEVVAYDENGEQVS